MPYSEDQRRALYVELGRRKKGKKAKMFKSMSMEEMEEYAHSPLKKELKRSGKK